MLHHRRFGLMALAFWSIPGMTEGSFGPGEAARHSVSRGGGQRLAVNADFKVLVWYRTSDPLGTFQDQIYDVRKGEYTPKVDEWIKDVKTKHPGYYVVVRDVDLKREKGETELLKVGSVIYRELLGAAGVAGIAIGSGPRESASSVFGLSAARPQNAGSNRAPGLNRSLPFPGRDRSYLTPGSSPFPVPVPIPNRPR
jgi:hypothetical protein